MLLKLLNSINLLVNLFIPKVNITLNISRKTYFIRNVFRTDYHQKALVSYISDPFLKNKKNTHTNYFESLYAADALSKLGYNVDVVDYDHYEKIPFKSYDVIYGFGNQFEASFQDFEFKGKRIAYSPGCNTVYSNKVSCQRLKAFENMGGLQDPRLIRATNEAWPLQKYLSDAIICLGNEFVLNTYKQDYNLISYYKINCFPLEVEQNINISHKDFSKIKHNLLWFGSQGSVHKGLDLVLGLIEQNPKLKLYIRGLNLKHEYEIINRFQHLVDNKQVDVKPFLDINSEEFGELMQTCGAVIFPSASEGGGAALLTVMKHGGLIPIITKSCGLDIDEISFVANDTTLDDVAKQLNQYLQTPDVELHQLTEKIVQEIDKNYSRELYKSNLCKIIKSIVDK